MKVYALICGLCVMLLVQCCRLAESQQVTKNQPKLTSVSENLPTSQTSSKLEITKEAAVDMAKRDVVEGGMSPEDYNFAVCEPTELWAWRVILEPKDTTSSTDFFEYVVIKVGGGRISSKKAVALKRTLSAEREKSQRFDKISRDAAVDIAKRDAAAAYGSLSEFKLVVGELPGVWRIVYSLEDSVGGGPQYVINKETGEIVHKLYAQ